MHYITFHDWFKLSYVEDVYNKLETCVFHFCILLLIIQLFFFIDIIHCIFFFNDCTTQWLEKDSIVSWGMLTIHMLEHHGGSHYILPSKKCWLYFTMCHMFKLQLMQGISNLHPRYFVPLLVKDCLCKTYASITTLVNGTFYGIISSRF